MKIFSVQMPVQPVKEDNLAAVHRYLDTCKAGGADLVVLPEMFDCPYHKSLFRPFAEPDGGMVWQTLSDEAKRCGIYLVAGSVPELGGDGKIYNTCYVFDRAGRQIAKHRKMHLFDLELEGEKPVRESDVLSAGSAATVFDTEFGKMGVCVCYDMRFPELLRRMADQGAQVVFAPAAFFYKTGQAHWEMLLRMRAVDNQCFVVGAAPAADPTGGYKVWGHSMIVDPWGEILAEAEADTDCVIGAEADLSRIDSIRRQLPLLRHRRQDIYRIAWKDEPEA